MSNLPAIKRSQSPTIVSKIKECFYKRRDFSISDYVNGLAALSAAFFRSYPLPAIGAFMTFILLGGLITGFSTPVTTVTRVVVVEAKTPVDTFVQETILTCEGAKPEFLGNSSTFEGEEVGTEITEPAPPKVVVPLVDPVKNVRPATQKLKPNSKAFINKWAPVAQRVGRKCGVPASIILAQALLESNSGVSALAQLNNNYFGHKCFSRTCGKGHCSNYTDDTHKDFFVVYRSAEASFTAHAKKISEGRYTSLKKNGKNYRAWAKGLKAKGYATAGHYASSLINTIEREGLARFDR